MYGLKMFDLFCLFDLFVGSECRIFSTKWLLAQVIRDSFMSVILAAVSVMSWK
jgi:hypothetical protein